MKYLALALMLIVGCNSYQPVQPIPDHTVPPLVQPVSKTTRADLCQMLAVHIEAGHIDTTDDLVRVLQIMSDAGEWTKDDSAAVDAVLPGLTETKRALTPDDAAKLKSVK